MSELLRYTDEDALEAADKVWIAAWEVIETARSFPWEDCDKEWTRRLRNDIDALSRSGGPLAQYRTARGIK